MSGKIVIAVIVLLSILAPWSFAQAPNEPLIAAPVELPPFIGEFHLGGRRFEWGIEARAEAEYNSNVWEFSDAQENRFDMNLAVNQANGRYRDMDDKDDVIIFIEAEPYIRFQDNAEREYRVAPIFRYSQFTQNEERNFFEFAFDARQSRGKGWRNRAYFQFSPNVFRKNYLATVTDFMGTVSAAERVYMPADYDQWSIELSHRRLLWSPLGAEGKIFDTDLIAPIDDLFGQVYIEFKQREFDAPFGNRDFDAIEGGIAIIVDMHEGQEFEAGYSLAVRDSPNNTEVLILDEPTFGFDFNGDMDTTDLNTGTIQKVDRSKLVHTIYMVFSCEPRPDCQVWIGGEYRLHDYQSSERFDINHNDRTDHEFSFEVGGDVTIDPNARLRGVFEFITRDRHGTGLINTNESGDYDVVVVSLAIIVEQ